MILDDWKEKIVALIGIIISLWILCPLPEVSIIVGAISGHTITNFLGLPPYTRWAGALAGVPLGWLLLHETGLMDEIKEFFNLKEDELTVGDLDG